MSNKLLQTKPRAKRQRNDSGATLVEYAIALALLFVVFATASLALMPKITRRGYLSIESGQRDVPCFCKGLAEGERAAGCKSYDSYEYKSELQNDGSPMSCM